MHHIEYKNAYYRDAAFFFFFFFFLQILTTLTKYLFKYCKSLNACYIVSKRLAFSFDEYNYANNWH